MSMSTTLFSSVKCLRMFVYNADEENKEGERRHLNAKSKPPLYIHRLSPQLQCQTLQMYIFVTKVKLLGHSVAEADMQS